MNAPQSYRLPPATILVLDDDEQMRVGATRALSRMGHRVLTASSAAAALQLAADWPSRIDLLLCDLVLPGLGGREAANALQARRPEMQVLYTSGFSSPGSFRKELAEDGVPFLGKPFELATLQAAVDALLGAARHPFAADARGAAS